MYGSTRKYMTDMFSGKIPIRRTNPKAGESEYYYFKPGQSGWSSLSEVETVDVPTKDTPNPYLQPQIPNSSLGQTITANSSFEQPMQFAQNNMQMNDSNIKTFWKNVIDPSSQNNFLLPNSQDVYSLSNIASTAYKVYKMSTPQNPIKTDYMTGNFILGTFPLVKRFNQGFNIGKLGAVAQLTYEDLKQQEQR